MHKRRLHHFGFRLSDTELVALETLAEFEGLTKSGLLRRLLFLAARKHNYPDCFPFLPDIDKIDTQNKGVSNSPPGTHHK